MVMGIRIKRDLVGVSVEYVYRRWWKVVGYRKGSPGRPPRSYDRHRLKLAKMRKLAFYREINGAGDTLERALDDFAERYLKARKP